MSKIHLQNKFFFLRHGEAENNIKKIISASRELYPLTPRGHKQIERAAHKLSEMGLTKIYASPIKRTHQTAGIVAHQLKIPVEFDERLMEIKIGQSWRGHDQASYWEYFHWHLKNSVGATPPGTESWSQLKQRMLAAFMEINDSNKDETILLVSHADPLWMLECGLLDLTQTESQRRWLVRFYHRGELRHVYQTPRGWRFVKL